MSVTSWFLVSSSGTRHRLPREMIFVGREDCELMLQSRSVDKQHAVINYDASADEHLVKDLGSLNGTFVNDLRIPDQTYITLKLSDVIRFGYDSHIYILERSQHKVPEEALKHEKYTSQLQLGQETPETKKRIQTDERRRNSDALGVKSDKSERKINTDPSVSRPTPLYGQPSWWGEADEDKAQRCDPSLHEHHTENHKDGSKRDLGVSPDELQDGQGKPGYSYRKEPSYFEIPTKEIHSKPKTASQEVQEIPTKDTDHKPPATPPVAQGHASFTIEFDDQTPGKMKIKDHVSKLSIRQRRNPSKESIARLTEVMSVENKVADWLVQSDATMRRSLDEQSGSDELLNKTFKDAHHLEDPDFEEPEETQMVQSMSHSVSQKISQHPDGEDYPNNYTPDSKSQGKPDPKQAFVIEILDDTQQKKRSQSFTNNMSSPDFQSALKSKLDKRKGGERLTSSGNNPPTQQFTIPLKGSDGPQRAGSLRREKTEIRMSTSDFSSRSASKTFGSVGRRSKLSQDFAAELLRVSKPSPAPTWDANSTWVKTPSSNAGSSVTQSFPTTSHTVNQTIRSPSAPKKDNCTEAKTLVPKQQDEDDSLSDTGTYTIEDESPDKEVVEARSLIDQVFGVGDNSQTSAAATVMPIVGDTEGHDSLLLSENSSGPKLGLYSTDLSDTTKGPVQMQSMTTLTPGGTRWVSRWASLADTYSDSHRRSDYSETGQSSRSRRVLPRVPLKEKIETPPPTIHIQPDSYLSGVEKSSQVQKQKWDPQKLSVQDDLDPDSLSDASKSDDGSVVEQCRKTPDTTQKTWNRSTKTSQEEAKDQDSPTKLSTATLTQQHGKLSKSNCSPPHIDQSDDSLGGDNSVSIVRQESYTKERASDNIHLSRLPQISSQPSSKDAFKGVSNQDTQSYLKDTEDVLASLEAKLLEQQQDNNGRSHLGDSFSGESDTSSTISGKNASVSVPRKPVVLRGLLRGSREPKTSDDPSTEKSQSGIKDSDGKADPGKRFLLRRNLSSLDFGADLQSPTTRHWPDAVSDQESSSLPYKKYTIPLQKEGTSKSIVHNALARSNSLSAPRPTRASMLRRARLGEASDNEGTETDRMSQNSDVNPSANSRGAQESKKLSRLDILALPRKRTGSFNTPSDTESSMSRTGFSNHSTESGNSVRKASVLDPKALLRKVSNAMNRQPIIRGRSSSAKYASSTARSQQNPRIHPAGPVRAVPRSRDSEGEGHESDAFQNWTSHSAEIARLSQDLAKDLAILAQEIHDVAGDTEAQSASTDKTGPAISTHEELRHQIPEASLNFQKEYPAAAPADESEQIVSNRQSMRPDELTLNNMMLNPVSQLSLAIRENTEQLTEKIKALFHNKMDVLGEIEAKINEADDSPPKASNKEIASILRELRRVQKQLEVINTVIDPRGNPRLSRTLASAGVRSSRAASHRGGGATPSSRRMVRSTDRESSLV
ncbi:centrosomal protein of 170 kDa protein B-like isoform X2 [Sinocyclocheilus rhinocerous]|uniref:centrosomal protein of 170 kDa protein B-like isoform X2 n=1 Tax=Sinocyclocheilus rhinocerous TaxID=307959 RepID=UPI0007B95E8D|nr:PREDICTED: centrosomal protein of 170 kDa protein B-like isoform X2 [Sinocyclocheilus rhinocerous]